ncbi:MAG: hypothetical protein RRB13_02540 [bacterium]|nr:hypothetical protein [bacterium]
MEKYRPTDQQYYAPQPGKVVRFFRTFLLWQFWRFLVINYKMTRMIVKSHH